MREQLKRALDNVHADQTLKEQTRDFLARRTRGYTARSNVRPARLAAAAACVLLLLTGAGGWACFTPTSTVSIDVNPSLELNVNRFDRVVSVTGVNQEGQALADTLDLTFLPCASAVEQVLDSPDLAGYLEEDPAVAITVVGDNTVQRDRLLSGVEDVTAQRQGTYCCALDPDEAEQAQALGLSYGKYRAYLDLRQLDPDIAPEEVQQMSMREIRVLLASLAPSDEPAQDGDLDRPGNGNGNGAGAGNGSGNGFGNGGGSGAGNGQGHRYGQQG